MIDCIFQQHGKFHGIRIQGHHLTFLSQKGAYWSAAPLDKLKWSIIGIIDEFPDLKQKYKEIDNPKEAEAKIKEIAIERFKEKISKLKTENEIKEYLKEDLKKHHFEFKYSHKKGHRIKKE